MSKEAHVNKSGRDRYRRSALPSGEPSLFCNLPDKAIIIQQLASTFAKIQRGLERPMKLNTTSACLTTACLLLQLAFSSLAHSETSVWRVSNDKHFIYLAGTFHLLNANDHPLPEQFEKAYTAADELVFEIDINGSQTPEYQSMVMKAMLNSDGKSLESKLKPETYQALSTFLESRNIPITNFLTFSPGAVTLMVAVIEYQRIGMSPYHGVESWFNRKALTDKKSIGELETIDQQLEFIRNLGVGQEDEIVLYTLKELERIESFTSEMKNLWRTGDINTLDSLVLKELREKFPDAYATMIVNRNNAWIPKIEKMLEDKDVEAVMVGAAHMAGPDGLIHQLKAKGYTIQQL